MIYTGQYYTVKTHWGFFRLDEGAYQDYLEGKLWITFVPGEKRQPAAASAVPPAPVTVSDEAVKLCAAAEKSGIWAAAYNTGVLPYVERMRDTDIGEMTLSVRASNGLMRAGAKTLGRLAEILETPGGIRNIRNLGTKSEKEILRCFYEYCYANLTYSEKLIFWQRTIDERNIGREIYMED